MMIKELKDILPVDKIANPYGFKNFYGVRLPLLRNIAKMIVKEKRYDYFINISRRLINSLMR